MMHHWCMFVIEIVKIGMLSYNVYDFVVEQFFEGCLLIELSYVELFVLDVFIF